MLSPSAYAAMMPYSIPLCTILTKCPAPLGPQCRYPCFGGAAYFVPSRGARDVADAGGEGFEDRIQVLDGCRRTANHQAIASLQAPDTAAGAYVHVLDSFRRKRSGATDVIDVIRIAAVDENVAGFEVRRNLGDGLVDYGRGNHQPDRARLVELADHVGERGSSHGFLLLQILNDFGATGRTPRWCGRCSASACTMLEPILPRPTIPNCIVAPL